MDRTSSNLSQESLLSEGTYNVIADSVGMSYIESFFNEMDTDLAVPENEFPEQKVLDIVTMPSPTCKRPCFSDYPGPYCFQYDIRDRADRAKWMFSRTLSKLFVNISTIIPMRFKWNWYETDLRIRALLVYTSEEYFEHPVLRCPGHAAPGEPSNKGCSYLNHVVRCNYEYAEYHEDIESKRLSVVVPVDPAPPGAEGVRIEYSFTCKNSCTVGMNRRATSIIFTLERSTGEVIGRQIMKLRICSCPKRDIEKEERDFRERVQTGLQCPPGKKLIHGNHHRKVKFFSIVPGAATTTVYCEKSKANLMAQMVRSSLLLNAFKEKRKRTAEEEALLQNCSDIMSTCSK